jgi:hypothetical protein
MSTTQSAKMYRETSARTARLLAMGKGFNAIEGIQNEDLGGLVMLACEKKVGWRKNAIDMHALIQPLELERTTRCNHQ